MTRARWEVLLLAAVGAALAWSMVHPYDWFTWFLEVTPVLIGVPALIYLRRCRSLRFTTLLYACMALHMIVLIVGGHYSYARVPLFDWIKRAFDLSRNHYDRLGHFVQGFVPAMIAREVLLRKSGLRRGRLLSTMMVASAMLVSACYELVEWIMAISTGSAADDFLGTQGDPWDTQEDMAMALVGSMVAVFTMGRWHDRALARKAEARADGG